MHYIKMTINGAECIREYPTDTKEINIESTKDERIEVSAINWDPEGLQNLEKLILSNVNLRNLDTSFAAKCPKLRCAIFSKNLLSELNMVPFASCSKLEIFDVSNNKLANINTIPLKDKYLLRADFSINQFKEKVDLSFINYTNCWSKLRLGLIGVPITGVTLEELQRCREVNMGGLG
ncbi:MAG: leucine-rich repeat domain-containing protein [Promethearchaeota archaeon]